MDAVKLLLERASAMKLQEPGPSEDELEIILLSALRARITVVSGPGASS